MKSLKKKIKGQDILILTRNSYAFLQQKKKCFFPPRLNAGRARPPGLPPRRDCAPGQAAAPMQMWGLAVASIGVSPAAGNTQLWLHRPISWEIQLPDFLKHTASQVLRFPSLLRSVRTVGSEQLRAHQLLLRSPRVFKIQ